MENSIDYLLKEIYLKIPTEILFETFRPAGVTLDSVIKEDVIVDVVLRKCNLYSGKLAKITLRSEYAIKIDVPDISFGPTSGRVYKIPPEVREYRDISHAITLSLPHSYYHNISYNYGTFESSKSMCSVTSQVLGSNLGYENQPVIPIPILLNDNIIKLEPTFNSSVEYVLSCLLKYDSNFTNISPNSLKYLADLCVLATKALIYIKLIIPIENNYLVGGQNLGKFKEIVDSYQDANEKFDEVLEKFRGSTVFDKETFLGFVSLMT